MKKISLLFSVLLSAFIVNAQGVKMPQPSPTQTIKQDFGLGNIELTYSRPALKGREAFKDESPLAPLGKMWRTGANAATKISFTDPINIGGKTIETGTYVLYAIPGAKTWTIILNKGLKNWGTDGYKQEEDVVRFDVESMKMKTSVENLTMQFANLKPESCELHIMWANTAVSIPMSVNIKDRIKEDIIAAMNTDKKPYWQAANFYYEWEKDLPKALENVNKAIGENEKGFWMYLLKAKIQRDMNDKDGATKSAEKCIAVATEQKNDEYVKLANELIKSLK